MALTLSGCGDDDDGLSQPVARTAKVERATVSTRVTASGALTAVTSQGLGFPKGAQLKEVLVRVGDQVRAGQVLARIDDFAFQQQLNQQQAQLNQQRAQLDLLANGTAVPGSQATLDQARRILSATQRNVQAIKDADDVATRGAQRQLDLDRRASDQAARTYSRCLANPPTTTTAATSGSSTNSSTSGSSGIPTGSTSGSGTSTGSTTGTSTSTGSTTSGDRGSSSGHRFGRRGGGGSSYGGTYGSAASASIACATQQQAKDAADRQVVTDQNALAVARQKETVDATQGQLSAANARQSVVSAQNTLNSASTDRPSAIAAQSALVTSVQAGVALAQRDVQDTVLRAPVDGTVSVINGNVGEFVGPSTGTTALAPGSYAALPGGSAATPVTAVDGTASKSGNSAFMVLNDLHTFQVVVPFPEADAVKLAADRPAKVTFDAIPDLSKDGTVLAVSPGPTSVSGVVSYYATILLTDGDPRLKDGVTAQAAVVATYLDNVLSVPNNAVNRRGEQSTVTVAGPDGANRPVTFQPGLVGDARTQVLAGLAEGQLVQVSRAPAKSPPGIGATGQPTEPGPR